MRHRREFIIAAGAVLALGAILAGYFILQRPSRHPGQPTSISSSAVPSISSSAAPSHGRSIAHVLITQNAANALAASGAQSAAFVKSLNRPGTFEIIHADSNEPDLLPAATHVESFRSYQAIQQAFESGTILPGIRVILYDDEHWSGTPLAEQQNPFTYVPLAEKLVHGHGLLFMNAPGADLKQVLDPSASNQYDAYLAEGLPTLAKYTDVFEIQAQNATSVSQYISFATQALQQARAANKAAIALLGITAKDNGPSSAEILSEIAGTVNESDGYWFNIPGASNGVSSGIPVALPVVQDWARM